MKGLTLRVSEMRKLLMSLHIIQHNLLEILTVKRKAVSDKSKKSLNYTFAEFDGNSRIKEITDRINLDELEVDDISKNYGSKYKKVYTNQVSQVLIRWFQ